MIGGLRLRSHRDCRSIAGIHLVAAVALGLGLVCAQGAAGRAVTSTACSSGSIQAAVDAAQNGATIEVCDGTYTEQVVIPLTKSNVTLSAVSKNAVIVAPESMSGEKAIVEVAGAHDITIKGFTIRGPGGGGCDSLRWGVEVDNGGSATVDSNDILDIRDQPFSGCQNGTAIGAGVLSTVDKGIDSGSVTAISNRIVGFQKNGISLRGKGSVDTIRDNTIVGAGGTTVIGQNGIQVSYGATATVSGNTISDALYSPRTVTATGILVAFNPGDVTVKNNVLRDTQTNIYVYGIGPDAKITISGNTISGGDEGIHVEAASRVHISDNTTKDQANFGLLATEDASDNTFEDNKASGVTGKDNYDCADQSVGNKTAKTANTWTNDTGDTVSPDGISSPPGAPPPTTTTSPTTSTPTTSTPTPTTPTPTTPGQPSAGGGESGGPIDDLEVPPVIVVPDVPVAPTSPADAVDPTSVKTTSGAVKATGGVKAAQTAQTVVATMHQKKLSACALGLTAANGDSKALVARGFATAPQSGFGRMVITVRVVPAGKLLLEAHFGGVLTLAHAKCVTTENGKPTGTVTAFKTTLVVLQAERVVTAPGSFVPDKAVFTPTGKTFLTELRAHITNPLLMRCDGYTAVYPPSPVDAHTLSTQRAEAACNMLNKKHLLRPPRIVAHGHTEPIATNNTEAGRRQNRRVEVTIVHRVRPQV